LVGVTGFEKSHEVAMRRSRNLRFEKSHEVAMRRSRNLRFEKSHEVAMRGFFVFEVSSPKFTF